MLEWKIISIIHDKNSINEKINIFVFKVKLLKGYYSYFQSKYLILNLSLNWNMNDNPQKAEEYDQENQV
jgi:hypothetical protein